jgi:hypothetical protein
MILFIAKISEISVYADKMFKFVLKNNPLFFSMHENEEPNDSTYNAFTSVSFDVFWKYQGTTKKERRG